MKVSSGGIHVPGTMRNVTFKVDILKNNAMPTNFTRNRFFFPIQGNSFLYISGKKLYRKASIQMGGNLPPI